MACFETGFHPAACPAELGDRNGPGDYCSMMKFRYQESTLSRNRIPKESARIWRQAGVRSSTHRMVFAGLTAIP
jgi:hypothetical protein